jgi:hypothetical protein
MKDKGNERNLCLSQWDCTKWRQTVLIHNLPWINKGEICHTTRLIHVWDTMWWEGRSRLRMSPSSYTLFILIWYDIIRICRVSFHCLFLCPLLIYSLFFLNILQDNIFCLIIVRMFVFLKCLAIVFELSYRLLSLPLNGQHLHVTF